MQALTAALALPPVPPGATSRSDCQMPGQDEVWAMTGDGSATPRLVTYLALAHDIGTITRELAEEATRRYRADPVELTVRDDVLIGLLLKMDSSFRALVDDARVPRSEAMHHLKTLMEGFLYFFIVGADMSDDTAQSVRMEGAYRRLVRLKDDPTPDPPEIETWTTILDEYKRDGIRRIGETRLDVLAKRHGLSAWYARVYRLACEPAHIADLWAFIPDPPGEFRVGPSRYSATDAEQAVWNGLQIVLTMLDSVNSMNKLGLHVDVEPLRKRLEQA